MFAAAFSFLIGIFCVFMGLSNRKGNIELLHSYHRHRVSEEDRLPFGKKVGLGTILCGVGIMLFSIFMLLSILLEKSFLSLIGEGLLLLFLGIGLAIAVSAMIRYNKGIF